jgi:hypothetical protein
MPAAQPRRPGTYYMIGRRTERRVHLFRPDKRMDRLFLFCLGVGLAQSGVVLVAVVLMSNHYHAIVYDPDGSITRLTEKLNLLLTKATQTLRGWKGVVFDAEGPSYVELLTPRALIKKIGYALANPTLAGLVRKSADWPGVRTRVEDIGVGSITVERPTEFFAEDGCMPAEVVLRFEMPEVLIHIYGVKQARERIAAAVEAHEQEAHRRAAEKRWVFKGAERVLKVSPYSRAKSLEDHRELNPRYAGELDEIKAAVARDREFVRRYRAARERWLLGDRHVVWPYGTDAMVRRHWVPCDRAPT